MRSSAGCRYSADISLYSAHTGTIEEPLLYGSFVHSALPTDPSTRRQARTNVYDAEINEILKLIPLWFLGLIQLYLPTRPPQSQTGTCEIYDSECQ